MKQVVKIILAAAAVVALAVPAIAADKLIVKNATSGNAFKVDDAGTVTVRNAGDTADVFTVNNTGLAVAAKMGLGTSNPQTTFHNAESSTVATRGIMASQHNAGAQGASILFRKSRGTEAVPAILSLGDYIGAFVAQYYNGVAYDRSAQFGFRSDLAGYTGPVTPGSTTAPTMIFFQTGASAQAGDPYILAERMRVSSQGNVVVGNLGGTATGDMATSSTNGFLYIPNVAGALTTCATVTQFTGHVPVWFDTASAKICTCQGTTLKCTAALN